MIYNALAMAGGYVLARLLRLPETDARAISMETGIHNTGLGLILVFNFLRRPRRHGPSCSPGGGFGI
ncbi:MAG: hypothetical protein IPG32_16060 [Saprospirales bacterium]|nr:hypothetical protein [Saprospirales bacterium]